MILGLLIGVVLAIAPQSWFVPSLAEIAPPSQPDLRDETVPPLRAHPLPPTLAAWHDSGNQGDYFSAVQPVRVGYLVWSEFPVQIYVEAATDSSADRSQAWVEAVTQAIQEWSVYLPLQIVSSSDEADIAIWRTSPALQNPNTSVRARSAETQYEVYVDRLDDGLQRLSHRFTILLRPGQPANYIRAAARHELGHALGIWGHSPIATDALYFSQVRNPPSISARDINTLKRIYEQPTRLGWRVRSYSRGQDS